MTTSVTTSEPAGSIPAVDPGQMIDANAVAKLLNVSKRHVDRLDARALLPRPIRLGRSVRWRKETIVAFLAASERAGRLLNRQEWEAIVGTRHAEQHMPTEQAQ